LYFTPSKSFGSLYGAIAGYYDPLLVNDYWLALTKLAQAAFYGFEVCFVVRSRVVRVWGKSVKQ
jgi:hypothetical protein